MSFLLPVSAALSTPFVVALAMTLLGSSAEPTLEVSQTRTIPAPPAAVWARIGEFCDIGRWHGQARTCALSHNEGQTVRSLNLRDIGTRVEVQLDRDENATTYSYALLHSPWPVKQHRATLTVTPAGDGAVVAWRATFRLKNSCDEGAVSRIEVLFRDGRADIAHVVARQSGPNLRPVHSWRLGDDGRSGQQQLDQILLPFGARLGEEALQVGAHSRRGDTVTFGDVGRCCILSQPEENAQLKLTLTMPVYREGHIPAGSRAFASMQMFSGVRTTSTPASSRAAASTSTKPTCSGSNQRSRNTAHPKVKAAASVRGTTLGSPTMVLSPLHRP